METRSVDSSKPDSGTAPVWRRESSSMRNVNNVIRRDAGSSSDDLIPFFCECQSLGCYSGIWLSAAAFDLEVAAQTGWLLLEGHEPSALWHRREPLPTRETVRSREARPSAHPGVLLQHLPATTAPGEDVAA